MTRNKSLVLIAGASSGIGVEFFNHYCRKKDTECYGIGRKYSNNPRHIQADLCSQDWANAAAWEFDLEDISTILYMHLIGTDMFESEGIPFIDDDKDGIDDEVYRSNVTTLKNILKPLKARSESNDIPLHVVNIGSISDIYMVPYWQSFSKSKNEIRRYMKEQPDYVKSIFLNVSSVDTCSERYGRPFADTKYWLKPEELVQRSLPIIEYDSQTLRYIEADIFNPDPKYKQDYFTNLPELLRKWKHDMGYKEDDIITDG